ncbi:MAG: hypothetical protein NT175_00165 [Bacteroidetes bacterium]|nr:hypothetical protein [Bacteroidota bacterium]
MVKTTDAIFLKDVIHIFLNPKKPGEALMKPLALKNGSRLTRVSGIGYGRLSPFFSCQKAAVSSDALHVTTAKVDVELEHNSLALLWLQACICRLFIIYKSTLFCKLVLQTSVLFGDLSTSIQSSG